MHNKNLSESIADRIKRKIIIGEYAIGEQLPNEQDLSEMLNVSRPTIREAIKILASKHVVQIERGKGTFVAAIPGLGEDPFGLEFVSDKILMPDLCAFRSTVEPEVCYLAAKNASSLQINEMHMLVKKMNELCRLVVSGSKDEWMDGFIDLEIGFHSLIYKMTGNVIFERMTDIISRSVIINCTALNYRKTFDFEKYTEIHTLLYESIKSKDSEKAKRLSYQHSNTFSLFL